ncbi:hypothetical protein GCM10023093_16460 [Nemorincola caseinilytica]|uniref:Secretion system C-terminal sorting domain-containing protein n=1 Tax=Nemorincola caseinilytica TaxID=2054315 RepID=A0ABP8NFJ9_9BACT
MKKALLSLICLLFFAGAKAQTTTVGHITTTLTDTMWHDSTRCQSSCTYRYSITIDTAHMWDMVIIRDSIDGTPIASHVNTTGASPWTIVDSLSSFSLTDQIIAGAPGSYIHFARPTMKIIYTTDTMYVLPNDSLQVNDPCEYDMVSGRIFFDGNANCVYDAGEDGPSSVNFTTSMNLSSPTVSTLGYYSAGSGLPFTIQIQKSWMVDYMLTLPAYYAFIFPAPPCYSGPSTYTTLPMTGVDFPLLCSHNIDVQCGSLAPATIRAHTPFFLHPYVNNTGCDPASGTLVLVKDSRAIYDATLSTHPADAVYGDTLVWNYTGLTSLAGSTPYWSSFIAGTHLTPDTSVAVGDTLCFRTYTNILPTDIDPSNNSHLICIPVVYSYDPNIKEVSPRGEGPLGNIPPSADTLTYTLHFQNTGTAEAYDIKVIDTLDADIDPASLKILGASHSMEPKWLAPNVVRFDFDYIYLPDSTTNEPASHGSVRFSVALRSGRPLGTQIKNTGYIYFDLNPPVVTNTTLNTIALPTAVQEVAAGSTVKVYPNPATDRIYVDATAEGDLWIMGLNGSVITTQKMIKGNTAVDISALPAGVYVVKTLSNTNATVTRFTKY